MYKTPKNVDTLYCNQRKYRKYLKFNLEVPFIDISFGKAVKIMLKTTAKIFLIFILLVIVAVATGFTTYTLTKRLGDENAVEQVRAAQPPTEETNASAAPKPLPPQPKSVPDEYYNVRLEGTTIGVYSVNNGKEEFLYHANIYKNDLSADDLTLLQEGVNLMTLSELTGFIENFTS